MVGIYKITSPSGKVYIGQSKDIKRRFNHYRLLHCKKQPRLYNSLLKHGYDNHDFTVLCECDFESLNNKERFYQEKYDVLSDKGLNCELTTAENGSRVLSNESKLKISIGNSGVNNGMYGVKHTEEFKQARRNYKHSPDSISKIKERSRGGNNPNAKTVLNLETGIYYGCVGDAAETIGMKRDTLKQQLNGRRRNKTKFIYA